MNALGADTQYVQLCRSQACFRARLTPKPWRCGVPRPPVKFPYDSPAARAAFDQWLGDYEHGAAGFKTCELVREAGCPQVHDSVRSVLRWHDTVACTTGTRLA